MIKLLPIISLSFFLYTTPSFPSSTFVNNNNPPPGTLYLTDSVFLDQTEVTNRMYLQFLSWTSAIYGKKSEEYKRILPDVSVWKDLGKGYKELSKTYLRHPKYGSYPVVGVSYEQAKAFCKWRSDRVLEKILIDKALIPDRRYNKKKDSIFTVEKYFSGTYYGIKPNKDIPYPKYDLPSAKIYKTASKLADSINKAHHKICDDQSCLQEVLIHQNCREKIMKKTVAKPYGELPVLKASCISCSGQQLTHIEENVREMTIKKGEFYGNSFRKSCKTPGDVIRKDDNLVNAYTGFRNKCEYVYWDK